MAASDVSLIFQIDVRGAGRPSEELASDMTHQHQNQDDHEDDAETAARIIPPAPTVRPGWQGPEQQDHD